MKELLQELDDLENYKNCLNEDSYRDYKDYLIEEILKEVTSKNLYELVFNKDRKKEPTEQRLQKFSGQFRNTKFYVTERNPKTGKPERQKAVRTNLQLEDESFCTKKEFEDESLEYKFDDTPEAKKLLKQFTNLFDDDSWLIINKD